MALDFTTHILPKGTIGSAYSETLTTTGENGSVYFLVTSGVLPNGLSLNNSTGDVTGTPTESGLFVITVEATDQTPETVANEIQLAIESVGAAKPVPSITPSRTTGFAPFSVHFDTSGTTSTEVTKVFHHLDYQWDFDDPNSIHPRTSGPLAGHVFEEAGTYTVTLTVTDIDGNCAVLTTTITVTDQDAAFPAGNTICFSPDGDFTDAPAGSTHVTTGSFDTVMTYFTGTRRLLLKRGQTFYNNSQHNLTLTGRGVISAFGSAVGSGESKLSDRNIASNNPIVINNSGSIFSCVGTGIVVIDINFRDESAAGYYLISSNGLRVSEVLFLRVQAWRFNPTVHIQAEHSHLGGIHNDENFFIDCVFEASRLYGLYSGGKRLVILGCWIHHDPIVSPSFNHNLRLTYIWKTIVTENDLAHAIEGGHIMKIHSDQNVQNTFGQNTAEIIISRNHISYIPRIAIQIASQNAQSVEFINDIIVEDNLTDDVPAANMPDDPNQIWWIGCWDVTIRNNISVGRVGDYKPTGRDFYHITVQTRQPSMIPSGIEIYNNIRYSNIDDRYLTSHFLYAWNSSDPIILRNNIHYTPYATTRNLIEYRGDNPTVIDEGNLVETDPLFVDGLNEDLHLTSASPAIDNGVVVPVLTDYYGNRRTRSSTIDSGASVYVEPLEIGVHTISGKVVGSTNVTGSVEPFIFTPDGSIVGSTNVVASMEVDASEDYSGKVIGSTNVEANPSYDFTQKLFLTTYVLPETYANSLYNETLTATGGDGNYNFSIIKDRLPTGLILNPANGNITGTPSEYGFHRIGVLVQDGSGESASGIVYLAVEWGSVLDAPDITITTSDATGTGPLTVFFDATDTSSSQVTAGKDFQHLDFQWDFGDPDSSHPRSSGPVASHVFEGVGVHKVSLIVTDPDGRTTYDSVWVSVTSEEVGYTETYCYSNDNNHDGAPAGATLVSGISSFHQILNDQQTGRRLLLKRGDVFNSSYAQPITVEGSLIIGAFGNSVYQPDEKGIYQDNPIITTVDAGGAIARIHGSGIILRDLIFEDPNGTCDYAVASHNVGGYLADNITILRCSSTGFSRSISFPHGSLELTSDPAHNLISIQDCSFTSSRDRNIGIGGSRVSVIGNDLLDPGTHGIKVDYLYKGIISENLVSGTNGTSPGGVVINSTSDPVTYTEYSQDIVVSHNNIRDSYVLGIEIAPDRSGDSVDEKLRNIIVEKNYFRSSNALVLGFLNFAGADAVIRDNVYEIASDPGPSDNYFTRIFRATFSDPDLHQVPSGVEVYNNTISVPDTSVLTFYLVNCYEHTGTFYNHNNLIETANATVYETDSDGSVTFDLAGNLLNAGATFVDSANQNFRLTPDSVGVGDGVAAPVLDGFTSYRRRRLSVMDVGAYRVELAISLDTKGTAVGSTEVTGTMEFDGVFLASGDALGSTIVTGESVLDSSAVGEVLGSTEIASLSILDNNASGYVTGSTEVAASITKDIDFSGGVIGDTNITATVLGYTDSQGSVIGSTEIAASAILLTVETLTGRAIGSTEVSGDTIIDGLEVISGGIIGSTEVTGGGINFSYTVSGNVIGSTVVSAGSTNQIYTPSGYALGDSVLEGNTGISQLFEVTGTIIGDSVIEGNLLSLTDKPGLAIGSTQVTGATLLIKYTLGKAIGSTVVQGSPGEIEEAVDAPFPIYVDRGQLHPFVWLVHWIEEQKKQQKGKKYYDDNEDTLKANNYWFNTSGSYANDLTETSDWFPNSMENYYNSKMGRGLHQLYNDYRTIFNRHEYRPDVLDIKGPTVFAHTFGSLLQNSDFKEEGSVTGTVVNNDLTDVVQLDLSSTLFSNPGSNYTVSTVLTSSIIPQNNSLETTVEIRNPEVLSDMDIIHTSGTSTFNHFTLLRLLGDDYKRSYLRNNPVVIMKSVKGLPRLRFNLEGREESPTADTLLTQNFLIPDHKFDMKIKGVAINEAGTEFGGISIGVWIHTKAEGDYVWSYNQNRWVMDNHADLTQEKVVEYATTYTFPLEKRAVNKSGKDESADFQCLEIVENEDLNNVFSVAKLKEKEFKDVSFSFDTFNPIVTEAYRTLAGVPNRLDQEYYINVFIIPDSNNKDKMLVLDEINVQDLSLYYKSRIPSEEEDARCRSFECLEYFVELDKEKLRTIVKFYNEIANGDAGRDASNSSGTNWADGGSRINYRLNSAWFSNTKVSNYNYIRQIDILS